MDYKHIQNLSAYGERLLCHTIDGRIGFDDAIWWRFHAEKKWAEKKTVMIVPKDISDMLADTDIQLNECPPMIEDAIEFRFGDPNILGILMSKIVDHGPMPSYVKLLVEKRGFPVTFSSVSNEDYIIGKKVFEKDMLTIAEKGIGMSENESNSLDYAANMCIKVILFSLTRCCKKTPHTIFDFNNKDKKGRPRSMQATRIVYLPRVEYQDRKNTNDGTEKTGHSVASHFRRGHFRMLGDNCRERKGEVIFVSPSFVNGTSPQRFTNYKMRIPLGASPASSHTTNASPGTSSTPPTGDR